MAEPIEMSDDQCEADLALLLEPSHTCVPYQRYESLDESTRAIRVLDIRIEADDEIHATTIHTSLDDPMEYEALSYCWGPPDVPRTIYIDQEKVTVRSSLHACLRSLCEHEQSLPIWVDYVCIDQRNLAERSWQVSMMGDICRSAIRINSWIGSDDAYSDYAFSYVDHHRNAQIASSSMAPKISQTALEFFHVILDRPYWKRLWVIQEMALAKEIWLICGSRKVQWEKFLEVSQDLRISPTHTVSSMRDLRQSTYDSTLAMSAISARVGKRETFQQAIRDCGRNHTRKNGAGLLELSWVPPRMVISEGSLLRQMLRFSSQVSTEPRDKIYTLLSVATDGNGVMVDYTKAWADVLIDAVQASYDTFVSALRHVKSESRNEPSKLELSNGAIKVYYFFLFLESAARCLVNIGLGAEGMEHLSTVSHVQNYGGMLHQLDANDTFAGYYDVETTAYLPDTPIRSTSKLLSPIMVDWKSPEISPILKTWHDTDMAISSKDPADTYRTLVRLGEIQLCAQANLVSRRVATCGFSVHYSRLAILTLITRNCSRLHSDRITECLEARRQIHPRPTLCTCEVDQSLNREAFVLYQSAKLEAIQQGTHQGKIDQNVPETFYSA